MIKPSDGYNGNGDGGQGDSASPLSTSDGHHDRDDVRQLVRAITAGWLKGDAFEKAVDRLKVLAEGSHDDRVKLGAEKGLIDIAKLGLNVAEFEDKANRLDSGGATDRVEFLPMKVLPPDCLNDIRNTAKSNGNGSNGK